VHVSACAAGTDAVGHAFRLVASGRRRWMLAGGTDSMINPLGVAGFCALSATSTRNEEPARASRPFDRTRDGFVMGEGAAALVLERFEDARARGAHVHAEVCGYGSSFDAHGISEPHPDGTRTLFFELNGQPREVTVRDRALRVVERSHPKANPEDPGQVGAPTAGLISGIAVQVNHSVERGAKLLTLEAMKMQSNIYAPIAGKITKLLVAPGQHVEAKDLLVSIAP